jgi:hypothetical protein
MLPFDPKCESSLAVFEQMSRSLPQGGFPLPEPTALRADVYRTWMGRYNGWKIPVLYSELIQKYGGVRETFPPLFHSMNPIESLLQDRIRGDAIGEKYDTNFVTLSQSNLNGYLCLVFLRGVDSPVVAFFNHDDDIVIESDTFGMYLWSAYFFLNCIHALPNKTFIELNGITDPGTTFQVLQRALIRERFVVHGFDSKRICATRDRTSISCTAKKDWIGVSAASTSVFDDLSALRHELRDMIALPTE